MAAQLVAEKQNTGTTSHYHNKNATRLVFYPHCSRNLLILSFQIGVILRDLQPSNILLDSDGHIAVSGFGLLKHFPSHTKVNLIST
jgi:serine/threonine protein kinase